jgi:hypothetical protein
MQFFFGELCMGKLVPRIPPISLSEFAKFRKEKIRVYGKTQMTLKILFGILCAKTKSL